MSDGFLCRKEVPRIDEKIFEDLKDAIVELYEKMTDEMTQYGLKFMG